MRSLKEELLLSVIFGGVTTFMVYQGLKHYFWGKSEEIELRETLTETDLSDFELGGDDEFWWDDEDLSISAKPKKSVRWAENLVEIREIPARVSLKKTRIPISRRF